MTNLLHSLCVVCVSEKTNRNRSSCANLRARGRNGERGKIYGADFVTRSNYFVTDACQIGDWASVVLAYHYEMLLAAAAVVSIRSSDSIDYTSIDYSCLSTLKKEDEQSRCMPSIGLIAMPSNRVVSSRPQRPSYTPFAN